MKDWKSAVITYNDKTITINDIYKYIDILYTNVDVDEYNYYQAHALRYLITLDYVIKYNLYKGKVLEVGGGGFFTYLMKDILGIDIVNFSDDLRKPIELDKDQFDVIICMEVIEHIIDNDAFSLFTFKGLAVMLNSFWNLLKEDGKVLITTPNSCGLFAMSKLLNSKSPLMFVFHAREYTPYEVKKILRSFNYEIDALTTECAFDKHYKKNKMLNLLRDNLFNLKYRGDDIFVVARKPAKTEINADVNISDVLINEDT
ncbi:MAG: class I SAM-dependent methyltransferase [Spirochaetaceae bacterium]|nr:class I SAM-dependent methyltransferase [Spirochaetaceae bacterium]